MIIFFKKDGCEKKGMDGGCEHHKPQALAPQAKVQGDTKD